MKRVATRLPRHTPALALLFPLLASCGPDRAAVAQDPCPPGNGGLTLPDGFCAQVVVDSAGPSRHLDVAPDGRIFLALSNRRGPDREMIPGGVGVFLDSDGDGRAETVGRFGENGGNEVLLDGDHLWFATDDAVLRYSIPAGATRPAGPPDTIVSGLPNEANHRAKSLALGPGGALFVNIGSPSNACQREPRAVGVAGLDPCPQLDTRAGIWRFDTDTPGQEQEDGTRFATGLRNTVALRTHPSGVLFGVIHGRDQLSALWSELFTHGESAELPAEEFVRIREGDDFGWPYCYFDPFTSTKVLAPEYGGDGSTVGRCAEMKDPLIGFPAHWAPNDLEFYTGTQFPGEYHGGAFIAFHGSWNRSPEPQGGYNVVFAPFPGEDPSGTWEVFADGFAGADLSPRGADHRPVGLAMGPDGSLYVSDSKQGRIWRIFFNGGS